MKKFFYGLLIQATYWVYRLWFSTVRYTLRNVGILHRLNEDEQAAICALWHDELLPVLNIQQRIKARLMAIVSLSSDGVFLGSAMAKLGFRTVHGSSSRGGANALVQIRRAMRDEHVTACVTVDGPRGPRHEIKDGVIYLAHKLNIPIVPVRTFMYYRKTFNSWDKFQLPWLFSRIHTEFGAPYYLDQSELTEERMAFERARLREKLDAMTPDGANSGWEQGIDAGGLVKFSKLEARQKKASLGLRFLHLIVAAFRKLGFPGIRRLSRFAAFVMWHILPKRRKLATTNISERLDLPPETARKLARQSFTQNVQSFLEILEVENFGYARSTVPLRIESPEDFELLRSSPRPIVAATGHIGAWELMAGLLGDLKAPSLVVVRRLRNPSINTCVSELRSARGAEIINHRDAALPVLRCLRKNGLAAFLVDHNTSQSEALFLPFLGKTAAVNFGPALLAVRANALIMPAFLLREGDGYLFKTLPALDTALLPGNRQERTAAAAAYYTRAVEDVVRQYPEQWFWMHKRWKTRPPNEQQPGAQQPNEQ